MGQSEGKSKLFSAVETGNVKTCTAVLKTKQFPELMNAPLRGVKTASPLQRSAWRGNIDMVMILLELGADADQGDFDGTTPLMWAAKRNHPELCIILIKSSAKLNKRSLEGLSALDYAILLGNYAAAYLIYEFDQDIQTSESYLLMNKMKHWNWVNYESLVNDLQARVTIQLSSNYFINPNKIKLVDPVYDPRETWGSMIKRIINFEQATMIERSDLPEHLQPQNRSRIGDMNPFKKSKKRSFSSDEEDSQFDA